MVVLSLKGGELLLVSRVSLKSWIKKRPAIHRSFGKKGLLELIIKLLREYVPIVFQGYWYKKIIPHLVKYYNYYF